MTASANRDDFTPFFMIWMASTFVSYLIALAGTFSTILNLSGKSRHLYVMLDLRGAGTRTIGKGVVELTRKTDHVYVMRVD